MPRRIYTYDADMGWNLWNAVSSAGAGVIAIGVLLFALNVVRSYIKGEVAGADPWTPGPWSGRFRRRLQSTTSSRYPPFTAGTPIGTKSMSQPALPSWGPIVGGGSEDNGGHGIHLPQPSYWPVIASLGLLIGGYGLIYHVAVAVIGGAIAMVSVYAWSFEPVNDPVDGPEH